MTTRDEWLTLAARCEAAKGWDREIDEAIREATGYPEKPWNYTGSIDAITALIEREFPHSAYSFGSKGSLHQNSAGIGAFGVVDRGAIQGASWWSLSYDAATPALARCAAFLRAKAEGSPHE